MLPRMATVDQRLAQIRPKIERAKEHISNVDLEVLRFLQSNPYEIAAKRNPQSRRPIYYLGAVKPVPAHIALVAGDAIQNLMSALDHLAYQIVCAGTSDSPPNPNWIYFPIQDDAAKYEAKKMGKIQGARPSAIKAIDALQPYKGGNDLLWILYRLNSIEKHRLLITVGSMFQRMNLAPFLTAIMHKHLPGMKAFSAPDYFVKPADPLFPLKVGDELFVDAPDAEVHKDMQFTFGVALSEPQVVEAKSLMELLIQLCGLVNGIVDALTPELS